MLKYTIETNKDGSNRRIYTLNDDINNISAHPAKFSPHDKFSEYRIKYKKEHNIFPFN